ncbi:hypothetical protein ILUMI_15696 [Ignelater luminosus]|uniref:Uncharacterized protein n=1 Tax=Ignelater luminosus TaxID=2038154 RepID=A0A8K0CSE1_IGNLU|nr:hypothetical protein ILUMI_15696 [Ignelater luminosus]
MEREIENKRGKYQKSLNTKDDTDILAWQQKCNMINTHLGGRKSTESWKILKSLRKEKKRDIITTITPDQWNEYFERLLNEDRPEFKDNSDTQNINISASPILVRQEDQQLTIYSALHRLLKVAVNQEMHQLYEDLRKAYDSIPQDKLWEAF